MNIVEDFKARGLLAQCTDEESVTKLLDEGGADLTPLRTAFTSVT